jgi:hypothetical protein
MLDDLVDVILDPDMGGGVYAAERVDEIVDDGGYSSQSVSFFELRGNIQPLSGRERELLPEGGLERESIVIFTPQELCSGSATRRADRVFYRGAAYRVRLVEHWREHAGFTRAVAELEERHG